MQGVSRPCRASIITDPTGAMLFHPTRSRASIGAHHDGDAAVSSASRADRSAVTRPGQRVDHGRGQWADKAPPTRSRNAAPKKPGPAFEGEAADQRTKLYRNRSPSRPTRPVVGCGKWIGSMSVPVSATWARNLRRDCSATPLSVSKIVDQLGSRHCRTWCIRSPVTTACCPRERMSTQQW
jgi:hypothetical protein